VAGVVALVLTALLVRHMPRRPSFEMAVWRTFLGDALPYALAAAVGAVYFRLAILIVQALTDATQTGYFGASFRVVEVLVLVPQLAVGAAFPIFARAASEDRVRLHYGVQKTLEASALIGGLVVVALFVGAPFVIDVVAGPAYHGAIPVLRWHAVALSASFVAALFGYVLLSLHRHRAVLVMNIAALVAIGVAGGILIPLYGARGAAAATAVSETVLGLSGAVALARSREIAALHVWVLPRLLGAAVIAVAVPVVIGLPAFPGAILGVLIYGVLALLLRAVPEELLVELRTLRPSRAEGRSTRTSRDGS
jgi:O-antigen/teichoic acid export membrane protein